MSKAALLQLLDRWMGSHECDLDSSLLTRFLTARDEDAFAALVHRHGPLVYGTCRRILGNRDDTDDAFQAVFFVLARRAHTLKLDRSIGPWLHGSVTKASGSVGELVYPDNSIFPLHEHMIRWFNHYLKGIDTGVERDPVVRY